jgi:hypothetical protein
VGYLPSSSGTVEAKTKIQKRGENREAFCASERTEGSHLHILYSSLNRQKQAEGLREEQKLNEWCVHVQ